MLKAIDRGVLRLSYHAGEVGAFVLFAGLVLLAGGEYVNNNSVSFDGSFKNEFGSPEAAIDISIRKQVGFLWAPNWLLTALTVLPLLLMMVFYTRLELEHLVGKLHVNGCVRRIDGTAVTAAEWASIWKQVSGRAMRWGLALFLLTCGYLLLLDFRQVVALPLLNPEQFVAQYNPAHKVQEVDWAIAYLFADDVTNRWANLVHSFAAYSLNAFFGAAFVIGMFMYFNRASDILNNYYLNQHSVRITLGSSETARRVFGPFFHHYILSTLLVLLLLFLMHLQNAYLRALDSTHILNYLSGGGANLVKAIQAALAQNGSGNVTGLVAAGFDDYVNQTSQGAIAAALVLIVFLFPSSFYNFYQLVHKHGIARSWPVRWISLRSLGAVYLFMLVAFFIPLLLVVFFLLLARGAIGAVMSGAHAAGTPPRQSGEEQGSATPRRIATSKSETISVFVSYSTNELALAKQISDNLEQHGANVFVFEDSATPGDPAWEQVVAAIDHSDFFVLLVSRSSVESNPVEAEISHAFHRWANEKLPKIVPVIVDEDVAAPELVKTFATVSLADYNDGITKLTQWIFGPDEMAATTDE